MKKTYLSAAFLALGIAGILIWNSTVIGPTSNEVAQSTDFPAGLESQVFAAVDETQKGIWDKKLTVTRVHVSEKALEGKWYAKDAWDWIAWQKVDGSWEILVSPDGFDCKDLKIIPSQYSSFFYDVTHLSSGELYCYSYI
ncbi:hypothetical protein IT396_00090 [Candidatus Nomurabacteria bacterium]|nr:hypothetical protein [Candidatus Nomurabacteria bacterium]